MALQDVTYQDYEILEIPDSPINTIFDISYPWFQTCELVFTGSGGSIVTSGEQITIFMS